MIGEGRFGEITRMAIKASEVVKTFVDNWVRSTGSAPMASVMTVPRQITRIEVL